MIGYPNDQANPAGALPVWLAPPLAGATLNITTDAHTQVKNSAGVFSGLTVNTAGTASTAKAYDGNSLVVTITISTPGVITWAAHGKVAGTAVQFTTTGALPTGLTAGTTYYVSSTGLTANTFQVADTKAHALAGTNSVATSGSQSGVQTAWDVSNLFGTYSTTAQTVLALPVGGYRCALGLIILTASSGAADLTVSYI